MSNNFSHKVVIIWFNGNCKYLIQTNYNYSWCYKYFDRFIPLYLICTIIITMTTTTTTIIIYIDIDININLRMCKPCFDILLGMGIYQSTINTQNLLLAKSRWNSLMYPTAMDFVHSKTQKQVHLWRLLCCLAMRIENTDIF